jgi:hypothetical protein
MNRLVRGSVILAAAAVSWACGGLDTDGIDTTAQLVADPGVVYVANTDSQAVFVEALNDLGQQLEGNFTVTNVGAGINVNYDTTFAPRPGVDNLPTRVRYFVRAIDPNSFVNTSFTVSANGQSVVIPVRITPTNLQVTFSNSNPAPGEVVTLTAPANVVFTSATTVTVTGGAQVVAISPDSTQISVVFATGSFAQTATVTNVAVNYLPGQLFNLAVTTPITTDSLGSFHVVPSTLTPAVGGLVTVTIPAPFKAIAGVTATVAGAGTAVVSIAADSSSLVFAIGPNGNGVVTVSGLRISGAPALGPFTLVSTGVLTSPPLTSFTSVFSNPTPNTNDPVTLTAAGFKFLPTTKVFFGNDQQQTISTAADSSSITFRAGKPGASGTISVSGIVLNTLTSVSLTLNASTAVTVAAAITTLAGANDLPTAANITIPDAGKTFTIRDNGTWFTGPAFCNTSLGGPCRVYKFVTTVARSFSVSATWQGTTDVGVYFINGAQAAVGTTGCDAKGAGAGGQPETCAVAALAAGTYYLIVDDFSPFYSPPNDVPPTDFTVVITGQ